MHSEQLGVTLTQERGKHTGTVPVTLGTYIAYKICHLFDT